ncbi:MAG: DNA repair exonuclease [Candidatus Abyssubacteria bacterium]
MSLRILHLADLHLGAPLSYLGAKAAQRAGEMESAFSRALKMAPEKRVHVVVIAGDLFDSFTPPPTLVSFVKAEFERLAHAGIPVILIPGTHDSYHYSRCVYRRERFPGTDVLLDASPLHKSINGHDVYFYGFSGSRDATDFMKGNAEGIHVALVHGTVGDAEHWKPGSRDFSLHESALERSGFQYVALGHHHNFRLIQRGPLTAVYPGTIEGLKFGENDDRYLVFADIDAHGVTLEKVKHNLRTLREVEIDLAAQGIESNDALAAAIERHAGPDSMLRISLSGAANFVPALDRLEAQLSERFFHLELIDRTATYRSEVVRSMASENTVRGIFVRKMLDKIENSSPEGRAAAELALRLGVQQFLRVTNENQ